MGLGEIFFTDHQKQQELSREAVNQFKIGPDGNPDFWNAYNQLKGDFKKEAQSKICQIAAHNGEGDWVENTLEGQPHSARIGHRAEVLQALGQRSHKRRRRVLKERAALWMQAARELHQRKL